MSVLKRIQEATRGKDIDIVIPVSTLAILIDNSTISRTFKEELVDLILKQIRDVRTNQSST